jgi:polygalacturonase
MAALLSLLVSQAAAGSAAGWPSPISEGAAVTSGGSTPSPAGPRVAHGTAPAVGGAVLSVLDFGARPDGVTNSHRAVTAAVAACAARGGCTLTFPPAHALPPAAGSTVGAAAAGAVYRTSSFALCSNRPGPPGAVKEP